MLSCLLDYRMSPGLEVRVGVGGGYRNCGTVDGLPQSSGQDPQELILRLKPRAAKACFPRCMVTCMEGFVLPVSQGSGSSAVSLDGKNQVNP